MPAGRMAFTNNYVISMSHYYVNQQVQANGDHEVHVPGCTFFPNPENRIYLGTFLECRSAVAAARRYYYQVNGCFYCLRACHTQ